MEAKLKAVKTDVGMTKETKRLIEILDAMDKLKNAQPGH